MRNCFSAIQQLYQIARNRQMSRSWQKTWTGGNTHPPLISKEQEHDDRQSWTKTACDAGYSILEREQLAARGIAYVSHAIDLHT